MKRRAIIFLFVGIAFLLSGCTLSLLDLQTGQVETPGPDRPFPIPPTATPLPHAEVTFSVEVPGNTVQGESIWLNILDEVTGLAFNPQSFEMQPAGDNRYSHTVLLPAGSVVKYRYTREGPVGAAEFSSNGRPVRYRLFWAESPGAVSDIVSRWSDTVFEDMFGRIDGRVTEAESGRGLADILVTAGGLQTFSRADGSYRLEGLPAGKHNLVAYAMNGLFGTFQQEAIVADGATTPAPLPLPARALVEVTFTVILPQDTVPGIPVRIAGNLMQLGDTHADLAGGLSTLAEEMPVLSPLADGRQSITLSLPAGADLRYKYTLGDGFWNAEHDSEGAFKLRQMIVPASASTVEDVVANWGTGNSASIWFDVDVPASTPVEDTVSIQFNPFGWTQPIPMWRIGERRWAYLLISPLDPLGTIGYRYCRNQQCGAADDAVTAGNQSGGRPVSTSLLPQNLRDMVNRWAWLDPVTGPVTVPGGEIPSRGEGFIAGIELQNQYHPTWASRMPTAFKNIQAIDANWVVLTPTWTYTRISPPVLETVPGTNPLAADLIDMIGQAKAENLNVALLADVRFPFDQDDWWAAGERDGAWWDAWFENYRAYVFHLADIAASQDAKLLILGGDWLGPALTNGRLADGSTSGVPPDSEFRWRELFEGVRSRYGGNLAWSLAYTDALEEPPLFLDQVDMIYVDWYAPLADRPNAASGDLVGEAARRLDSDVLPALAPFDLPVVLRVLYPSAEGGITGCLPDPDGGCLRPEALSPGRTDLERIGLDLDEQAAAYNAVLSAVVQRSWIDGFVSGSYFPPVVLRDRSPSVYGKPAGDALSFWFPRLLGRLP